MNLMLGAIVCAAVTSDEFEPLRWEPEEREAAARDIAAGNPRWKLYGRVFRFGAEARRQAFSDIMRSRYGVTVELGGKGVVTQELMIRAGAYNGVVQDDLDAQFGPGVIERAWEDADPARVWWRRAKVVLLAAVAAAVGWWALAWWRVGRR